MASTDFLLQPAVANPRASGVEVTKAMDKRADTQASAQRFSSVYAQQQRDRVQQEKPQARAKAPVKQPVAKVDHTDKQSASTQARAGAQADKVKDTPADPAVDKSSAASTQEVADGKALPPESGEEVDELAQPLIDPLLLMALTAQPAESKLTGETGSALLSVDEAGETEDITLSKGWAQPGELLKQKNSVQLTDEALTAETDELVELASMELKSAKRSDEKSALEVKLLTVSHDSNKSAVDTILNKAVGAAEALRADVQARSETNQVLRQVPGPAVAMQQPGWSQQVTEKVMWMSSQNLQSAEIKLDPAELGRLDVKISMSQEQTQITFNSAHAGVRDSLESQMHRLRELFAQQGMQNVDVNVADHSHAQQEQQKQTAGGGASVVEAEQTEEGLLQSSMLSGQQDGRLGVVDYYA